MKLNGLWLLVVLGCEGGAGPGELVLPDGGRVGADGDAETDTGTDAGTDAGADAGAGGDPGADAGAGGDPGDPPLPPIPPELAPCDFENLGVRNLWLTSHSYLPETGGERPLAGADWVLFADPQVSVSFLHPPDWTAHTLVSAGERGVYIMAPQSGGFFEYSAQYQIPADLTARALAEAKLRALLAPGARPQVVCEENATYDTGLGSDNTLLVVVSGADVFYLHTSVTFDPGSFGFGPPGVRTSLTSTVRFHAAPLARFTEVTRFVYLPIIYQLLSGAPSDPDDPDSDGDGYANSVDAYPFDPTRH